MSKSNQPIKQCPITKDRLLDVAYEITSLGKRTGILSSSMEGSFDDTIAENIDNLLDILNNNGKPT